MSDRVRHHPPELIDELLNWCVRQATARPAEVLATGLAYVHGLNEHQLAHAAVLQVDPKVALRYPLARRVAEIRGAERAQLTLDAPAWLADAASTIAGELKLGAFLFRP